MAIQTIEQQRAKFVLDEWKIGTKDQMTISKELKSAAESFPSLILMNGLGQAAAFYKEKQIGEHKVLYQLLSKWLCHAGCPYAGKEDLMTAITQSDQRVYRAAQSEALAFLIWVKKFAKAYIK